MNPLRATLSSVQQMRLSIMLKMYKQDQIYCTGQLKDNVRMLDEMGGHDHHHHEPYKVPDYKIYKVEAKELVEVERSLARMGLKDPWLRNEAWRFDTKIFGTHRQRISRLMLRGLPLGIALTVATVALEKAFGVDWHDPRGLHKGHGHGHGDDGHH